MASDHHNLVCTEIAQCGYSMVGSRDAETPSLLAFTGRNLINSVRFLSCLDELELIKLPEEEFISFSFYTYGMISTSKKQLLIKSKKVQKQFSRKHSH